MMLRLAFSATLLLPALGAASTFSYDRCAANGPQAWTGWCQNASVPQTPVDVCGAVAFPGPVPQFGALTGYDTARDTTILNNRHTIQVNIGAISDQPTLQLDNISYIVGQASDDTVYTWSMQQMHLHWGRTGKNDEGSEHYLFGTAYPAEMHYVHWNKKYDNISEAVASGNSDALLVVGIFLEIGSSDSELIQKIATNVSTLSLDGRPLNNIKLSDLFDGTGDYYSYKGSLTTPTCNPIVTWVVMKTPKTITQANLDSIKEALENPPQTNPASAKFAAQAEPELISLYGNYRPLQKIAGRTIYGSNSAALGPDCGAVTEPTFTCSSAVRMVFSPVVLLSTLSVMLLRAF